MVLKRFKIIRAANMTNTTHGTMGYGDGFELNAVAFGKAKGKSHSVPRAKRDHRKWWKRCIQ